MTWASYEDCLSVAGRCWAVSHAVPLPTAAILFILPEGKVSEKAMAPHFSTLAWKIPWTEEPGRLQSMGSQRVGHDWATSLSLFTFMHALEKDMVTHSSVLAWRILGMGEPGGLPSAGSHRVRHNWSDLAAAEEGLPLYRTSPSL